MSSNIRLFEEPETLKVGLEKTRKQILDLLKVKNMTISQISKALEKDQSTIYRHIRKLEDAGFIEVKGERKEHHIPERIYGRTADVFLMSPEPIGSDGTTNLGVNWNESDIKECLDLMEKLGYDFDREEITEEMCYHFKELDKEINEEFIEILDDDPVEFFSIIQTKFMITLVKIMNGHQNGEKIKDLICEFEENG